MRNILFLFTRSTAFALWSLRRRLGQFVPVVLAFLLLMGAVQAIGALHDVSSVLAREQIARSWRGPYDLLVRPQTAVSQSERSAGWINPQSILETYGGISSQQVEHIHALAHVAEVVPFAVLGWQHVDVMTPVALAPGGVYRVSATWEGSSNMADEVVRYVDVTSLSHLITEGQLSSPIVQHIVSKDDRTPAIFRMTMQALQEVVGVPGSPEATLQQALLENLAPAQQPRISIHVERLSGDLSMLPGCVKRMSCWQSQEHVQQRVVSYSIDSAQLLRFSHTNYVSTSESLRAGEVTVVATANDTQGPIYRDLLPGDVATLVNVGGSLNQIHSQGPAPLPFSMLARLPLLPDAVDFIPLEQACDVNGGSCYSGLYIRLNGVEHYGPASLALLQSTAAAIAAQTGLHVDILDGSSLRKVAIVLAHTSPGIGSLSTISAAWRVVGVAVQIVKGVDALQEMLLVLCSSVCLLAIGVAGVLVGVGRRKEAALLRQMGWSGYVVVVVFVIDGLALCLPGYLIAGGLFVLIARILGTGSSLGRTTLVLLAIGLLVYCCCVASSSCSELRKKRSIPLLASNLALILAVFLIAIGCTFMSSFNNLLVVTILGNQVREALEGPQFLLLLLIIAAALLTVSLCARLLLYGRRDELALLSMLGWERLAVLLRIMQDGWVPAFLSGEIGVVLALGLARLVGASLTPFLLLVLILLGPLMGMLLVSLGMVGPACQETKRVFRWR